MVVRLLIVDFSTVDPARGDDVSASRKCGVRDDATAAVAAAAA